MGVRRSRAARSERVRQGEDDQVVGVGGLAQEGAAVVDVKGDAGVRERLVGVVGAAELGDDGIDLDGVDVADVVGEGDGNV